MPTSSTYEPNEHHEEYSAFPSAIRLGFEIIIGGCLTIIQGPGTPGEPNNGLTWGGGVQVIVVRSVLDVGFLQGTFRAHFQHGLGPLKRYLQQLDHHAAAHVLISQRTQQPS
jgi:hypothetical protein